MKDQLELINYKQWVETCSQNDPCLIDQILPEDAGEFIIISGKTGIGKSIFTLHMAFCLATGTPFYGFATQKVKVGYIAMEGGKENIRQRFLKIAAEYPDTDNLFFNLLPPMDLPRHFDQFCRLCEGCRVVIFDNLRQVTSGKYLDMNYAAAWLKEYQRFLIQVGAVGALTHHIKKPSGNDNSVIEPGDVYNLKGATEYVDAATTVLLLERQRQRNLGGRGKGFQPVDNNALMLYFAKQRIATRELEPVELRRNYETCSFDLVKRR